MPELPEVETVCRQLEPEIEGRRIDAAGGARRALVPADAAGQLEAAVERRDDRGAGAARQVPAAGARRRADAGHAPADDRQPGPGRGREQARSLRGAAALRGRALGLRAPPAGPLRPRRRPRALVHRSAPLRRGLPDRRRRPRRALRQARGRAVLRPVHPRGAGRDGRRAHGAAEVLPARPVAASPGSATSTPTRRSSGPACTRSRRPAR